MRWLITLVLAVSCQAQATLTARSWLITDTDLQVQSGQNYYELRSMASLTKVLTVMVAIDDGRADADLVELAMVRSSNAAADELCRRHSQGYRGCIRAMNEKAMRLDAWNTYVSDATGLSAMNRTTARDMARIILAASRYPAIVNASHKISVTKRRHVYKNTNPLVGMYDITVSKTGWTMRAGGCIAVLAGDRIVVLLGSRDTRTRIRELEYLLVRAEGVEPSKLGF